MAGRIVVVTGTDTGVGKTFVGAALANAMTSQGRRVVAIKPVESGCEAEPAEGEDGCLLAQASGQSAPRHALQRLRAPIAPPLAAMLEDKKLAFAKWVGDIEAYANSADIVLVEGAGGLLSPLTWEATVLDLAAELRAPLLVVAADRLGTLNHTRLTLEVIRAAGLQSLGVVLCAPEVADRSTGTNAEALSRVGEGCRVSCVARATQEQARQQLAPVAMWVVDG